MSSKKRDYALILNRALESWNAGVDPALIELPEKAVFPHLICAAPATARKSRVTGVLLGKPTPKFLRRGRSIRYRLNDVLDWLGDADSVRNTAEASLQSTLCLKNDVLPASPPSGLEVQSWQDVTRFPIRVGH